MLCFALTFSSSERPSRRASAASSQLKKTIFQNLPCTPFDHQRRKRRAPSLLQPSVSKDHLASYSFFLPDTTRLIQTNYQGLENMHQRSHPTADAGPNVLRLPPDLPYSYHTSWDNKRGAQLMGEWNSTCAPSPSTLIVLPGHCGLLGRLLSSACMQARPHCHPKPGGIM